jgi:N-methylhydantoinase A
MPLDVAAARQAIAQRIAGPLGIAVEQAAWGIHQIVNQSMANAARVHVLERGKDPRRFPVFAFGGAGPVHGYRIAQALGSPALIAPFGAGVTSTVGFLTAPTAFDFVRSWRAQLDGLDWQRANALLAEMEAEGRQLLESSGISSGDITQRCEADMRYVGQGYEIRVPLPPGPLGQHSAAPLLAAFEATYRQLYGRLGPPVPVELINWRVVASGPQPELRLRHTGAGLPASASARKGQRQAYFPEHGGYVATPVYDRYLLGPGTAFDGPAVVEERESTVIVGPGGRCRVDGQWNLIIAMSDE